MALRVRSGVRKKAEHMRVQKYLEDKGVENDIEISGVTVYLRVAKMLSQRTGWKLSYIPRDKSWEYQLEIPLQPRERHDDLIMKT